MDTLRGEWSSSALNKNEAETTRKIMNSQTDVLKRKRHLWNCPPRGLSTDLYCILPAIFDGTVNLSGRILKLFHFFQVIFLVICLYRHIEQFTKRVLASGQLWTVILCLEPAVFCHQPRVNTGHSLASSWWSRTIALLTLPQEQENVLRSSSDFGKHSISFTEATTVLSLIINFFIKSIKNRIALKTSVKY